MIIFPQNKPETDDAIMNWAIVNRLEIMKTAIIRSRELAEHYCQDAFLPELLEKYEAGRVEHKTSSFLEDVDHYEETKAEVIDIFWYTAGNLLNSHYLHTYENGDTTEERARNS